jgi:hypothetical protein
MRRAAFQEADAVMDAAEFGARLRGDLHRWSMGRALVHQFSLVAKRAPEPSSQPPGPVVNHNVRWQRYRTPPLTVPGLAAVKHGQQHAAPGGPRGRSEGPSSMGELYAYYKRIGMLEVYFSLFPG